jgi:hypothetical protein
MSATTTGIINWTRSGNLVTLYASAAITGTSNATTFTMTGLPTELTPAAAEQKIFTWGLEDNTTTNLFGQANIASTGIITFNLAVAGTTSPYYLSGTGGFTASGTKGLRPGWTVMYTLQ